jgi:hypothetical protein
MDPKDLAHNQVVGTWSDFRTMSIQEQGENSYLIKEPGELPVHSIYPISKLRRFNSPKRKQLPHLRV